MEYWKTEKQHFVENRQMYSCAWRNSTSGAYRAVQLWNPADSGKDFKVFTFSISKTLGQDLNDCEVLWTPDEMSAGTSTDSIGGMAAGQTVSAAATYADSGYTAGASTQNTVVGPFEWVDNHPSDTLHDCPFILTPGNGLVMRTGTDDQNIYVHAIWAEV